MEDQTKNLILATVLSFLVIVVWAIFFPPEVPEETEAAAPTTTESTSAPGPATGVVPPVANDGQATVAPTQTIAVADAPRLNIDTPKLLGTISLLGGRIDDLSLKAYRETLDEGSDIVHLFNPVGEANAFYALYGWAPGSGLTGSDVPGVQTLWTVETGETLAPGSPVTLRWESPSGLIFRRMIEVDEDYLFTISQSIENPTSDPRRAAPYGFIARHGLPADLENFFIVHEGVVGMSDGTLIEEDYDTLTEYEVDTDLGVRAELTPGVTDGWIGFTDKYWMATLIADKGNTFESQLLYQDGVDIYQTQTYYPTVDIAAGTTVTHKSMLFAGAKEWATIRQYQNENGIPKFLDSIDWGWFYFLTKPIFAVLHWLNALIGNMGWAIICLTLLIKALLFPLAYKSHASMAKMKALQPEMEKIKEKAGDDRQKLQTEMMALYKKEKVNPAAGCLPILLQIPIFFSLYKVIFVTLELRHAPFFGPFQDLSAPDPTSIMNFFGLLPWGSPEPGSLIALILIGILPLLLGISMWLQQKLNPAPTDPTQQMIFAWMPWVFMFMLGGFASGLIVYWIANNTITFTQQYLIMRAQGYTPDVFGNITSSFKRKPPAEGKK